jgi:hypothetical protein
LSALNAISAGPIINARSFPKVTKSAIEISKISDQQKREAKIAKLHECLSGAYVKTMPEFHINSNDWEHVLPLLQVNDCFVPHSKSSSPDWMLVPDQKVLFGAQYKSGEQEITHKVINDELLKFPILALQSAGWKGVLAVMGCHWNLPAGEVNNGFAFYYVTLNEKGTRRLVSHWAKNLAGDIVRNPEVTQERVVVEVVIPTQNSMETFLGSAELFQKFGSPTVGAAYPVCAKDVLDLLNIDSQTQDDPATTTTTTTTTPMDLG